MSPLQILALLLALSASVNFAFAAALIARRGGAGFSQAVLTGGGAGATTMGIYFAAVSAYR
ncbi:hypothetical protein ACFV06_00550 [Streptomyces sp. NPDC059618]|uniref:hypothetical protein n=1 Tax=Streptomyces sp. NPDC059618 TaxID=3346887 RepID=UPI0036C6A026